MPLFTINYRKRKAPIKKALQFQVKTGTYEKAIEMFHQQYSPFEYMITNPEEQDNEYFVGNISNIQRHESWLKSHKISYRIGEQAYDIQGNLLPKALRPLFIRQLDIKKYDQLMTRAIEPFI